MTVDGKIAYAWRERGDFSDYHLHVSETCDGEHDSFARKSAKTNLTFSCALSIK
jgi:hypothetical protein